MTGYIARFLRQRMERVSLKKKHAPHIKGQIYGNNMVHKSKLVKEIEHVAFFTSTKARYSLMFRD